MSESTASSREFARARAFRLVHELQVGRSAAADELDRLATEAEAAGWDEVVRVGLFGRAIGAWLARSPRLHEHVDALIARATADRDPVMAALGLAVRAGCDLPGTDGVHDADADLARAAALLESAEGGTLELITAHTACGIAFVNRWLWELGDEQYAAALAVGEREEPGTIDHLLAPIFFNRAEARVAWASTLRQLGGPAAAAGHWADWEADAADARPIEVPELWAAELVALGLVLASVAGEDRAAEAAALLSELDRSGRDLGRVASHLQLAVALSDSAGRRPSADEAIQRSLRLLDPAAHPHEYELALYLAVELEAAAGRPAGLRCADRQLGARWAGRLAALGAMRSRIDAERRQAEIDVLQRAAHLDDLTGVGNRRALASHLADLAQRGVRRVALLLADLDAFKAVNDRYGHDAGDAALIGLARVLERNVRPGDLVVRLGGDEFAAVLADADLGVARQRACQVVDQVARLHWPEVGTGLSVAVSLGVAAGEPSCFAGVKAEADAALYEAKAAGGRRVVCRGDQPTGQPTT